MFPQKSPFLLPLRCVSNNEMTEQYLCYYLLEPFQIPLRSSLVELFFLLFSFAGRSKPGTNLDCELLVINKSLVLKSDIKDLLVGRQNKREESEVFLLQRIRSYLQVNVSLDDRTKKNQLGYRGGKTKRFY